MVEIETVRRFAGADPTVEDPVLEMCRDAAVDWFEKAGVPADTEGSLYELYVCQLAAVYYDNRGNADINNCIPQGIVDSVHQLRPKGGG